MICVKFPVDFNRAFIWLLVKTPTAGGDLPKKTMICVKFPADFNRVMKKTRN
jgi:hypothetical protein